jgi:hypothetical protein
MKDLTPKPVNDFFMELLEKISGVREAGMQLGYTFKDSYMNILKLNFLYH